MSYILYTLVKDHKYYLQKHPIDGFQLNGLRDNALHFSDKQGAINTIPLLRIKMNKMFFPLKTNEPPPPNLLP